jgi:hypothetical protein
MSKFIFPITSITLVIFDFFNVENTENDFTNHKILIPIVALITLIPYIKWAPTCKIVSSFVLSWGMTQAYRGPEEAAITFHVRMYVCMISFRLSLSVCENLAWQPCRPPLGAPPRPRETGVRPSRAAAAPVADRRSAHLAKRAARVSKNTLASSAAACCMRATRT